jgi:hypothetical protein
MEPQHGNSLVFPPVSDGSGRNVIRHSSRHGAGSRNRMAVDEAVSASHAHRPERNEKSLQTRHRRTYSGEGELYKPPWHCGTNGRRILHLAKPRVRAITALEGKERLGDFPQQMEKALAR